MWTLFLIWHMMFFHPSDCKKLHWFGYIVIYFITDYYLWHSAYVVRHIPSSKGLTLLVANALEPVETVPL